MKKRWIAFFSQTGSEIAMLTQHFGRAPDVIVTDNEDILTHVKTLKNVVVINFKKLSKEGRVGIYHNLMNPEDLVTLHGWLNIIPREICETYRIFNGHPGLINLYEDLKGKDPQERVWENLSKYDVMGSVVHRVTPEIDGGEILTHQLTPVSTALTREDVYSNLKYTSFRAWVDFLGTQL